MRGGDWNHGNDGNNRSKSYLEFIEWLEGSANLRNDYVTFLQTRQLHRPKVIIHWHER
jgi:hypothetical protein